jgi:hypothetical protein
LPKEVWEVEEPPFKSRSNTELVVRQSLTSKDMNMEAEEAMVLEAVTRQPVKTQQNEKT